MVKKFEDIITVYTQYRRVMDRRTDRRTFCDYIIYSPRYAYARAVKKLKGDVDKLKH